METQKAVDEIDLAKLAATLREYRREPLRETAKTMGVSYSTLSRLEQVNMPDLNTYVKACRWLGLDFKTFVLSEMGNDELRMATEGIIFQAINNDARFTSIQRDAIMGVVRVIADNYSEHETFHMPITDPRDPDY